jgi:hypothetical protein
MRGWGFIAIFQTRSEKIIFDVLQHGYTHESVGIEQ